MKDIAYRFCSDGVYRSYRTELIDERWLFPIGCILEPVSASLDEGPYCANLRVIGLGRFEKTELTAALKSVLSFDRIFTAFTI